jgi:dipeptidase
VVDFYTISNKITIGSDWDLASDDLVRVAIDKGWCKNREDFHFANCYSDFIYSNFSQAAKRRSCSYDYLQKHAGEIDLYSMMDMLRTHNTEEEHWAVDRSLTEWTVCVHKGFGPVRASQSVASLVCRLSKAGDLHLATGTSAPCLSLFKPIWMEAGLPEDLRVKPGGQYDARSIWWQHELLHREVLKDFGHRAQLIHPERDRLERHWIDTALGQTHASAGDKFKLTDQAFREAGERTLDWYEEIKRQKIIRNNAFYYDAEWRSHNRKANIPV